MAETNSKLTPREVANWLHNATDEEYVETFALYGYVTITWWDRPIPDNYDAKKFIKNMNIDHICEAIHDFLGYKKEKLEEKKLI